MTTTKKDRFIENLPKIGIRPIIDGRRRGVRESLEGQTMNMARSAAKLLSENLIHASGDKVACVIAHTTIGEVAEVSAADEKYARQEVGLTLTVSPSWCYGAETMDMHPTRLKAVWSFNGTDRLGAIYHAALLAIHAQKSLPSLSIYGKDVQDSGYSLIPSDVAQKLIQFAKEGKSKMADAESSISGGFRIS